MKRCFLLISLLLLGCGDSPTDSERHSVHGFWRLESPVVFRDAPSYTAVSGGWLELRPLSNTAPFHGTLYYCKSVTYPAGPHQFSSIALFRWREEGNALRLQELLDPSRSQWSNTEYIARVNGDVLTLEWDGAYTGPLTVMKTFVFRRSSTGPQKAHDGCSG